MNKQTIFVSSPLPSSHRQKKNTTTTPKVFPRAEVHFFCKKRYIKLNKKNNIRLWGRVKVIDAQEVSPSPPGIELRVWDVRDSRDRGRIFMLNYTEGCGITFFITILIPHLPCSFWWGVRGMRFGDVWDSVWVSWFVFRLCVVWEILFRSV